MAKKSNRREWTKDDLRQLKTLARQKTPAGKISLIGLEAKWSSVFESATQMNE
jgi:hypothetical protein